LPDKPFAPLTPTGAGGRPRFGLIAEQASTLEGLSGSRLLLALALGWWDFHFQAFGVPWEGRLPRFQDALEVVKALLSAEPPADRGRWFTREGVPPAGAPLQRPRPPLLLVVQRDAGVRRGGQTADGGLVRSRAVYETAWSAP